MTKKLFFYLLSVLLLLSTIPNTAHAAISGKTTNSGANCVVIDTNELDKKVKQEYIDLAEKYKSESCDITVDGTKDKDMDGSSKEIDKLIVLNVNALAEDEKQKFIESYLTEENAAQDDSEGQGFDVSKQSDTEGINSGATDNDNDNAGEPKEEQTESTADETVDEKAGEPKEEQTKSKANETTDEKADKTTDNKAKETTSSITTFNSGESSTLSAVKMLQRGNSSASVLELKKDLIKLGFDGYGMLETKYFGEGTEKNVKDFQDFYRQKVTGVADQEIINQIEFLMPIPFSYGKRHVDTDELKKELVELGFDNYGMKLTHFYGHGTEKNVRDFQRVYQLPVTGVAGQSVFDKIDSLLNSGSRHNDNVLSRGDRSDSVLKLKKDMVALGFDGYGMLLTRYFGDGTEKNLKDFQDFYRQKETGVASQEVFNQIDFLLPNPFSNGKRHVDTDRFKEDLVELGFDNYGMLLTHFYGDGTEKNVRDFQKAYGLKVTGVANKVTFDKVTSVLSADNRNSDGIHSRGDRNTGVLEMKKDLIALGFDDYGMLKTKYFGDGTEKNLKDFQDFYRQKVTGVADSEVFNQIDFLLPNPFSNGKRHVNTDKLKEDLVQLGFDNYGMKLTHFYGDGTEKNVRDFQNAYGIDVTGIAGNSTFDKIEYLLSNNNRNSDGVHSRGDRNSGVQMMKEKLVILGFGKYGMLVTEYFGDGTEKNVKDLQRVNKLPVTGVADKSVLKKIDSLLENDSKLSKYDRSNKVLELKKGLIKLGFNSYGMLLTKYFGNGTEKNLKDFQDFYRQVATGIAGKEVFDQIDFLLPNPFSNGKRHVDTIALKKDLRELGYDDYGMKLTYFYGDGTAKNVSDFQEVHNLKVTGITDEVTMQAIKNAIKGLRYTNYDLSLKEALNIQMTANPQTDQNHAYVSKKYIKNGTVIADVLNVRVGPGSTYKDIGNLYNGEKVNVLDEVNGWYVIEHFDNQQWVNATPEDVLYYLKPNNFVNDSVQRFQFLDLSKPSDISATVLNQYLQGKGILTGKGQAFIDASRANGINDIYLVSHASLETGNGTSPLATGVPVNKNGNITRDSKGNIAQTSKTVATVYNMFGINANDSNPLADGARKAFDEGWTTPRKAIIGGGAFISDDYINDGQNTLYKMRWNPSAMANTGAYGPQYATDIGWATKQIDTMYDLYQDIGIYKLNLDIPVYN